jgi:hypothetical protein
MMSDVLDGDAKRRADLLSFYGGLVASIRASDEISFKLLGAVPLFAGLGSGALSMLEKSGHPPDAVAAITLSLVGCVFTVGLFRWELRNIQKCDWFISRAARLERQIFGGDGPHQFLGLAKAEYVDAARIEEIKLASMWHRQWGKTEAEKLVYWAAIVAWLIPAAIGAASL